MDEVQAKQDPTTITKDERLVTKPISVDEEQDPILGFFEGKIEIGGDIMSSIPASEWKRLK